MMESMFDYLVKETDDIYKNHLLPGNLSIFVLLMLLIGYEMGLIRHVLRIK